MTVPAAIQAINASTCIRSIPDFGAQRRTRIQPTMNASANPMPYQFTGTGPRCGVGFQSMCIVISSRPHSRTFLNRNAFAITDTELNVIAALAIIGLRTRPKNG